MFWVFFEVALALGVAVGIVWWTFPKKKAPPKRSDDSGQS